MSSIKVIYAPMNYGDIEFSGVYDAFRQAGCNLDVFDHLRYHYNDKKNARNIRQMFIERVRRIKPDLIHLQIQHTTLLNAETIKQARMLVPNAKIVNYTIDARNYPQKQFVDVAKYSDFNFITSTGQLHLYRNAGVKNIRHWQVGYDPKYYYPDNNRKTSFEFDVSFVGNVNNRENYPGHHERIDACNKLKKAFGNKFAIFGSGWANNLKSHGSIAQKDVLSRVYHNSFCVLSISHFNNIEHYFSDRLLMCMASGRPTVSMHFPGHDSYFANKGDLLIANNSDDVVDKVKYLLNNPYEANFIGESGAAKVFGEHTYFSRINELLNIVGLK